MKPLWVGLLVVRVCCVGATVPFSGSRGLLKNSILTGVVGIIYSLGNDWIPKNGSFLITN